MENLILSITNVVGSEVSLFCPIPGKRLLPHLRKELMQADGTSLWI